MTDEQFQNRVKEWMSGAGEGEPIHRYLGMTWAMYCERMGWDAEDHSEELERLKVENLRLRDEVDRMGRLVKKERENVAMLRRTMREMQLLVNELEDRMRSRKIFGR